MTMPTFIMFDMPGRCLKAANNSPE